MLYGGVCYLGRLTKSRTKNFLLSNEIEFCLNFNLKKKKKKKKHRELLKMNIFF